MAGTSNPYLLSCSHAKEFTHPDLLAGHQDRGWGSLVRLGRKRDVSAVSSC
jgi:hypothetical protein